MKIHISKKGDLNMPGNLQEKKSADGYSTAADAVTPEGGNATQSSTGADIKKKVNPAGGKIADGVTKQTHKPEEVFEGEYMKKGMKKEMSDEDDEDEEMMKKEAMKMKKGMKKEMSDEDEDEDEDEMEESYDINSLFEGMDLSEAFKSKASMVFEAAVNEAAFNKTAELAEEIESNIKEEFETTLKESLDDIVENLDGYLDYIVKEWMQENELAIESGIKVEMAESFMDGLKGLFEEHNVEIDEETIDVVAELEEELKEARRTANKVINERLALEEEVQELRASNVFDTMTEGLSSAQVERFRILSEKLNKADLDEYKEDLNTLKESFFKKKSEAVISEDLDQEGSELIVEETVKKRVSQYDSVNAYANDLKTFD
jgi:hypothetical protein